MSLTIMVGSKFFDEAYDLEVISLKILNTLKAMY